MANELSLLYPDLLTGSYDCVDRIVLNAYFRMGHSAGGFRYWWQRLTGSDQTLDSTHLMRMAGRFSRRVRGWAKAHQVPVIDCSVGDRKHEIAEEHLKKTQVTCGVFLILVSRAQAPVWEVRPRHHLERKTPMPYVNHYSFHILDPDWGHVTIKISGHPPFPAQVILNGHEYVACHARRAGIDFTKEGNCFTAVSNAAGLVQIADTLSDSRAIGRLRQVGERWIYSCLSFALDWEELERSGFHYDYSVYQLEYSCNLIFEVGGHMEQVFQALIDRSRGPLQLKTIRTILGYRRRPRYRARKKESAQWEVAVERPEYDLTVFKLHCGKLTLKIYTKGERVLRTEAIAHNTQELECGRSLEKFPRILSQLQQILERFQQALSCMDQCFIADQTLEQLAVPSRVGQTRVGGLDFNRPRIRWAAEAVLALSSAPGGFTTSELARQVRRVGGLAASDYGARQAGYDLKKLRGKQMVQRIGHSRRYQSVPQGLKALTALVVLHHKVIRPLLAGATEVRPARGSQNPTRIDQYYQSLRAGMQGLFQELGLAA
jgi:hypothetical protein